MTAPGLRCAGCGREGCRATIEPSNPSLPILSIVWGWHQQDRSKPALLCLECRRLFEQRQRQRRQPRGPAFCPKCGGATQQHHGVAWCTLCGPAKGPR